MEFPRFVVKSVSGKPVYDLVNDVSEHSDALKNGWFSEYSEAMAQKPEAGHQALDQDEDEDSAIPPTRDEIEAKCSELGIAFDGRMKDATLLKKIEEALAERKV